MHPQTRSQTKNLPVGLSRGGKRRTRKHTAATPVPAVADDTDDELSCAADDLAYLRAERYREVDDEDLREDDARNAEAEVAALFKHEDTL